jgi:ATPase family associated with various cellular activities (AAA)
MPSHRHLLLHLVIAHTTTTTLQVAERQRELQHARDLVDMEQAVKQQELAAEALRLEAEAQRATAADMRSAALQRIRDECRAAQTAAAADQARHCTELEQRHGSSTTSSTSSSSHVSVQSKTTATAAVAATTATSSSGVSNSSTSSSVSAGRVTNPAAAAAAAAAHSASAGAALVDLLDALTAAGRSGDVPAMCSAITAVPAAARSSVAAALVPALGELAADLMAAASAADATTTVATAATVSNKLSPSLQGALQLCATDQWVKAYTALTAAVAESTSSSADSSGTALYALVLCEIQVAGGTVSTGEASTLLQRLHAQDTVNRSSSGASSRLSVSPLRSPAYAAVHAAGTDRASAHLACAAALHFLLLPPALLEAYCGAADCWRAAAAKLAASTAAALAATLDGGHMDCSSSADSASTLQSSEQQQQAALQREWQRLKAQCAVQSDAMEALLGMSGMLPIKARFLNVVNSVVLDKARGFNLNERSYNVRLEGSPGTGKTTVARLYAALLRDLGVFAAATAKAQQAAATAASSSSSSANSSSSSGSSKKAPQSVQETTGADLADGGVRQLKSMLQEIEQAGGGLLFVDEAYTLSPDAIGGQGKQVLTITSVVQSQPSDTHAVECSCLQVHLVTHSSLLLRYTSRVL